MKLRLLSLAIILLPIAGICEQAAYPSQSDTHIRFVDYDPYNRVAIYGRVGRETLVMFQKGEKILDIGGGDTEAWGIGTTTLGDGFFIKPTAASPNTNVHIVTNLHRVYSYDMMLASKEQTNYETIWYKYPDVEQENKAHDAAINILNSQSSVASNRHYTEQGSNEIAPIEAWDDGLFTYFRFPAHHDFPAIYYVGEDKQEHLVNKNVENDVVYVQKIAAKFRRFNLQVHK